LNSNKRLLVALADDSTRRADSAIGLHCLPKNCWLGFCFEVCVAPPVEEVEDWKEAGEVFDVEARAVGVLLQNDTSKGWGDNRSSTF
jgi:hypothetical protein